MGEPDENATLSLSTGQYRFGASSTATVVIADNEPQVWVEASANAWEEGQVSGEFTITRVGGNRSVPLTVSFMVFGTAAQGTDCTALPQNAVIPAGQNWVTVAVAPIDDAVAEGNETVVLQLQSGSGYRVVSPNDATVTVHDNEPTVSIAGTQNAAESGPTSGLFTISAQTARPPR